MTKGTEGTAVFFRAIPLPIHFALLFRNPYIMNINRTKRFFVSTVLILLLQTSLQTTASAQGVMLRASGAVNESVAGTATGMPLDAAGTLVWNPAGISALKKNEMSVGLGLIQPHTRVSTTFAANGQLIGSTKGEAGITPVPTMAFVWRKCPRSPFTYGISMAGVGGASSLYPNEITNPMSGRSANVIVLQVTPTVAVQVTERLSVGVAPVIDLASLNINPMSLGGSATAAGSLITYGTKYAWGGGFQIGTFYDFQNHFKAGFMFKSPIWAEDIYFTGTNGANQPEARSFDLNLPMTLSAGISYDGFQNTVIGMDVRYFDYAHTAGFKDGLVSTTVAGLGWESIWSIHLGIEHTFSKKLKGRMGYCWNENPIPGRSAMLNVSAPLMMEHVLSFGVGYTLARNLELSLTYNHAFEASVTGPIPGTPFNVTNTVSADTVAAGISKKW